MENKIKDSTENTTNNELGYMTDEMMMKSIDTPKKKLQYFWDYYKWRQMRSNGVEEKYITGDATDREKFQKWAETLEMAIGNPLYHWSHLELKRYLGYDGYLNGETAEEVWNQDASPCLPLAAILYWLADFLAGNERRALQSDPQAAILPGKGTEMVYYQALLIDYTIKTHAINLQTTPLQIQGICCCV